MQSWFQQDVQLEFFKRQGGDGNKDGCSVFFPTCSTSSCASQREAQSLASGESTSASTRIGSPEKMSSSEQHVGENRSHSRKSGGTCRLSRRRRIFFGQVPLGFVSAHCY